MQLLNPTQANIFLSDCRFRTLIHLELIFDAFVCLFVFFFYDTLPSTNAEAAIKTNTKCFDLKRSRTNSIKIPQRCRRYGCSFTRMTDQSVSECKTMRQCHTAVCTKPQWVPSNAFNKHSHRVWGSLLCKVLLWGRQMKQNPFCPWNSLSSGLIDKLSVHDLRVEAGTRETEYFISMFRGCKDIFSGFFFFFSPSVTLVMKAGRCSWECWV